MNFFLVRFPIRFSYLFRFTFGRNSSYSVVLSVCVCCKHCSLQRGDPYSGEGALDCRHSRYLWGCRHTYRLYLLLSLKVSYTII